MSRLWHISDIHLSFLADGSVKRPMDKRSWSNGSPNYVGYLDKIADFGTNTITEDDIVAVTGDITHDMKHRESRYSFLWFRQKTRGTIIYIPGNHDKYVSFAALRQEGIGERAYLLDSGEMMAVGNFVFGCFNIHGMEPDESKPEMYDPYRVFAKQLVKQAREQDKIPVFLSHYPVTEWFAKELGNIGIKCYLSGHIHCTSSASSDGNDWKWYNQNAAPTDDKTISGCFFSTGTTDVILNRHGQIFKEITQFGNPISGNTKTAKSLKDSAAHAFSCRTTQVDHFSKKDPFNSQNVIEGYLCRAKGKMGGSMYLTHVNGVAVEPQLIFGTPKLEYPYINESSRELLNFDNVNQFVTLNKWNGMNIFFYKYFDNNGTMFISAKTKGTAILTDGEYGNFFSLTKEVLARYGSDDIPAILMDMVRPEVQGMSFELCGKKEPHLVKYDFDIDLKPLFITYCNGKIKPILVSGNTTQVVVKNEGNGHIPLAIKDHQFTDYENNARYRRENSLEIKYEYEHFVSEGHVLYCLDEDGYVYNRTLYKIKPKDIEEVHWQTFDATIEARVAEAVKKLRISAEPINEVTVAGELNMGPKEWDKFGKKVMEYTEISGDMDRREVIVLCGLPGSGKSYLAQKLEDEAGYVRVNQDDLGSRNKCKEKMAKALRDKKSVVVDRCNFDVNQRKAWIDLAAKDNVKRVHAIILDTETEVCKERIITRKDHPTVEPVEGSKVLVDKFQNIWVDPSASEGFLTITKLTSGEVDEYVQKTKEKLKETAN